MLMPLASELTSAIGSLSVVQSQRHSMSVASASFLQRVWRTRFSQRLLTRQLASSFLEPGVGLTMEHVRSIRLAIVSIASFILELLLWSSIPNTPLLFLSLCSFDALVLHLRSPPVIAAAKQFLSRVHRLSVVVHGAPVDPAGSATVNVRVFLAAYMIAARPTHVFESMGQLEQAVFEVAGPLIATTERMARDIVAAGSFRGVSRDVAVAFVPQLFEFIRRFRAWKVPDEAKLTCRIQHALVALYQAKSQLPTNEPVDSPLSVELRTQIERLRNKLRVIAGAEALAQFDTVHGIQADGTMAGAAATPAVALGAYTPPGTRVSNEQLAHELLLDPAFQLSDDGDVAENPVAHRIRASFHRVSVCYGGASCSGVCGSVCLNIVLLPQAFWDSLASDLSFTPPCYVRVLRVLREIRDGVAEVSGARESVAINEVIDVDHIGRQAELGIYCWQSCQNLVSAVAVVIRRVQAPSRDAEMQALLVESRTRMEVAADDVGAQPGALAKALEFLLGRVSALRIDAANAR